MNRRDHWESVYRDKGDCDLSWFQARPEMSLSMIDGISSPPRRVIDIGGGQSALAGELLARGVEAVTVLDISGAAIERGKERLGPLAERVSWIVADVLDSSDLGQFDVWHDRAVFHFLTGEEERRRYVAAAADAVFPGGHAIMATFALTGPEVCSGLQVRRYDAARLAREFAPSFQLLNCMAETHATPWGKTQDFTYVTLVRT